MSTKAIREVLEAAKEMAKMMPTAELAKDVNDMHADALAEVEAIERAAKGVVEVIELRAVGGLRSEAETLESIAKDAP